MSENILKLISISPTYTPIEDLGQKALAHVTSLFSYSNEITIRQTSLPQFIDSGANLERIICPKCGKVIDENWWKEEMDKVFTKHNLELSAIVPCCKSILSLNELNYEWPAGFARFCIQICNPNRGLSDEELHLIETILDTKLKRIWAHY